MLQGGLMALLFCTVNELNKGETFKALSVCVLPGFTEPIYKIETTEGSLDYSLLEKEEET